MIYFWLIMLSVAIIYLFFLVFRLMDVVEELQEHFNDVLKVVNTFMNDTTNALNDVISKIEDSDK